MKTGYEIKGQDLADLVEYSRDPATDPVAPLASYGFNNTGKDFPVSRIPSQGDIPGAGIDINSYFNSYLGSIPPLLAKGYRPRVKVSHLNFSRAYIGTSQRSYYYLSRTDTELWIFRSYNKDSGYVVQERIPIDGTPNNLFFGETSVLYGRTTGSLSYSGIPYYVFVELFGGGGGGAGGIVTSIAWVSRRYSYGGSGGSGAGTCYMKIPVGPWRSDWNNRSSSTDYCFSIHKGGSGGHSDGWKDRPANAGSDGTNSYAYSPSGATMATAIRGKGGTGYNDPTPAYIQNSPNVLYQVRGGAGGQDSVAGSDIYIPETAYLDEEKLQLLWYSSSGGGARTDLAREYAGGGGGASRGRGADGAIGPNQNGYTAYFGAGGGGGWGQLDSDGNGSSGGPGGVSFFY